MSFDDFIVKWTGKPVDFDGIYPNQCMDLMHQYVYDVLGLTDARILAHPAAYQVFTDFTEIQYFEKIANTPTGIPQKGDIVLFNKTSSNPYGHVCIFIEGDANKFKSFDANYPVGSLPHVQDHTYGYCLGWLRFKGTAPDDTIPVKKSDFENLMRKALCYDEIRNKLNVEDSSTVILAEVDKYEGYRDAVVQKDSQLQDANKKITYLEEQLKELSDENIEMGELNATMAQEATEMKKTIVEQGTKINFFEGQIKDLRATITRPIFSGWRKFIVDLLSKTQRG